MTDDHFSREVLTRFLESALPREENRDLVRHLLGRCPGCSRLLQEVAREGGYQWLIRGLEETSLSLEPDRGAEIVARISRVPRRSGRAGPVLRYSRG
jgi:hypothetical protein